MRLGTLIRASTLLALFWLVTLGPRAYPAFVAARDAASLPRATLLVDSDGCERDEVHDQVWRCRSLGSLAGDGPPENRQAVLRYEAYGEEGPDRRYDVGTRIAVALAPNLTGGAPRLFDARRVADEAREQLRWLARQPVASVATVLLGWLALGAAERLRRSRRSG
ncbi:MAG: hypothetical protein MUF60_05690, partial [Vicinamibacterales bacterium]|nr:hypothetical protein [Vicinamibacterales bacterium]